MKHIPGHGLSSVDSHKNTPFIRKNIKYLIKRDFFPFRFKKSIFSMTAHIIFEKIDPTWLLRANRYVENDPILILFISGFRQKVSNIFAFTNQIQFFHKDPVSSVRPSEASSGRFLRFHPDSGGLLDFRYRLHFLSFFLSLFLSFFPGGTHWPQLGEPAGPDSTTVPLRYCIRTL